MVWWGEHELREAHDLVVRHGFSFLVIRNHLAAAQSSAALPSSLATPHGLTDSDDSMSLPQEMTVLGKVQIELDLLLSSSTTTTPVNCLRALRWLPCPASLNVKLHQLRQQFMMNFFTGGMFVMSMFLVSIHLPFVFPLVGLLIQAKFIISSATVVLRILMELLHTPVIMF